MARISADRLIGTNLRTRGRIPMLANPRKDSRVLKWIPAGTNLGPIVNYTNQRAGEPFWYFGVNDPVRGNLFEAYIPFQPELLDLPQLQQDYQDGQEATRRRNMEWWERLAEDSGQVLTTAASATGSGLLMAGIGLGSLYIIGRLIISGK